MILRGTSQNTKRIRPSEEHSQAGNGIETDMSGHRKDHTERGALTAWKRYRDGQIRIQKESDRARGTHMLETASKGTSQDTERIQPSEWHSRTGHGMGRDMSGHEKRSDQAEALTNWRRHREGQIRIQKEYNRARGTHILETALGGTSQDVERIRPSEEHSLSGNGVRRDKSAHGRNQTKRGELTP